MKMTYIQRQCVYVLYSKKFGVFYVGSTRNPLRRAKEHIYGCNSKRNRVPALYNFINENEISFFFLIVKSFNSPAKRLDSERELVKQYSANGRFLVNKRRSANGLTPQWNRFL